MNAPLDGADILRGDTTRDPAIGDIRFYVTARELSPRLAECASLSFSSGRRATDPWPADRNSARGAGHHAAVL